MQDPIHTPQEGAEKHNTCYISQRTILYSTMLAALSRSQWPRGLRRTSTAARLLTLGSNPARGMDGCLLCVVRFRSLRRADHSSKAALPTLMRRLCVI